MYIKFNNLIDALLCYMHIRGLEYLYKYIVNTAKFYEYLDMLKIIKYSTPAILVSVNK